MGTLPRLRSWFVLARFQTAAVTAVAPVWGSLAADPTTRPDRLAVLFALGIMAHLYGFVLNEVVDMEVDGRQPELAGKPLLSGAISRPAALALAAAQPPLALLVAAGTFGVAAAPTGVLLASIALATGYNLVGKRLPIPPLADALLGLSVGLMVVYGALVSGGLTSTALALAFLSGLQILFNHGIEGGVKDLESDELSAAHTTARWLGANVCGGRLVLPSALRRYAVTTKLLALGVAGVTLLRADGPVAWGVPALGLPAVGAAAATLVQFLTWRGPLDRAALKRLFSVHEMGTYALATAVAVPTVGLAWAVGLLLFPTLWYLAANLILYGRPLEPAV